MHLVYHQYREDRAILIEFFASVRTKCGMMMDHSNREESQVEVPALYGDNPAKYDSL